MKTFILSIILLFTLSLKAQQPNRGKFEALKVSFITERLDLTEKEAQEFWPVYNEFDKKYSKLKYNEMRNFRKQVKENIESLTEEESLELLKKLNRIETKTHNLRLEFATKVKTILPAKKILKLKIAEEDFKRKMLDRLKKNRAQGKNNKK